MLDPEQLFESMLGSHSALILEDEDGSHDVRSLRSAAREAGRAAEPGQRLWIDEARPVETILRVLGAWQKGAHPVVVRAGTPSRLSDRLAQLVAPSNAAIAPHEAIVVVTSGTTGAPKPVAIPADSVSLNGQAIAKRLGLTADDRLLGQLPFGHLFGLSGVFATAAMCQARVVLRKWDTPPPVLDGVIRSREITVVQGAPAFFRLFAGYWSARPLPGVRLVVVAGGIVEPSLRAMLHEMFPAARLEIGYGMTEAGPRISHVVMDDPRSDSGFVGMPFEHWETGFRDGEMGRRLALRGDALMIGYISADGYEGVDDDGWFVSNDLVTITSEGLYLHGRADRVFKHGGSLVNPTFVERAALTHEQVTDARCRAVEHANLGQMPVLDVVGRPGLVEESLLEMLEQQLEKPSVPSQINIVSRLPPRKGSTPG